MPLVGKVGRKRPRARIAMALLYLGLAIGALTTVYPFTVMVLTGFKGTYDQNDNAFVPKYWSDTDELLAKYRDDKYSGNVSLMESASVGEDASPESVAKYEEFLLTLPPDQWSAAFRTPANNVTSRLNNEWQAWLKRKYGTLDKVNTAYREINGAFQHIVPPPEKLDDPTWRPKAGQKWTDWLTFKSTLPAEFRIPVREQRLYQEFLRTTYRNQFGDVPEAARGEGSSFETARLTPDSPVIEQFVERGLPETFLTEGTIEGRWSTIDDGPLPVLAAERAHVVENGKEIKREFATRNYRYVMGMVAVNGRALLNTVIFVVLAIVTQLTVNPIAAYALSRYPMKSTGKILVFLLATMAFPAEVAMIPSFLLLKDLGLLNTFAALVLPAAASGYMIFLLKGFFDSLPQEVFESGQIDGAPEWLMMLKLAFPLSKPVLGYMALLAFMGAYGAFLYAFLVAQDRNMWTLMVYVYQLQTTAPKSTVLAATTLVALPTLVVFLFAQRVIMRGIVLPGER